MQIIESQKQIRDLILKEKTHDKQNGFSKAQSEDMPELLSTTIFSGNYKMTYYPVCDLS